MGFVFEIGPGTTAVYVSPKWNAVYIGKGIFRITPEKEYIRQTGATVTSQVKIDFPHTLLKTVFRHTNETGATSHDPLDLTLEFKEFGAIEGALLEKIQGAVESCFISEYRQEHPIGTYIIKTNTTDAHRVYIAIYVQGFGYVRSKS